MNDLGEEFIPKGKNSLKKCLAVEDLRSLNQTNGLDN
jgi:hypothetical protein